MNLKWSEVNFATKYITFLETKNGASRHIKMSVNLEEYLFNLFQRRQGEYVFTNENGNQLNRMKVQRMINAFKEAHPMQKDWNYHALRHSFAFNFLKNGGDMYKLKAILGHKTIAMTVDLYGDLRAEDIEDPSPYNF